MSSCIDILARDVAAFHFCQLENEPTCTIPEFVHSICAQMSSAPHLVAYREMLHQNPDLMNLVTYQACLQDPARALAQGILEPLIGKIGSSFN